MVTAPTTVVGTYLADLRRASAAWAVVPWLPVVAGVQAALFGAITIRAMTGEGGDLEATLALPLQIVVAVSLPGVAALAYVTTWAGAPLRPSEAFGALLAYLPRYLVLGLLLVLYAIPIAGLAAGIVSLLPADLPLLVGEGVDMTLGRGGRFVQATTVAAIALLGTFAGPELALRTRRARTGLSDGVRLLWQHRRTAWPYALAPVAVTGLSYLTTSDGPGTVAAARAELVLSALATILGIWLLGGVVAFYLRVRPVHAAALPIRVVARRGAPDPVAWAERLRADALRTDPSYELGPGEGPTEASISDDLG